MSVDFSYQMDITNTLTFSNPTSSTKRSCFFNFSEHLTMLDRANAKGCSVRLSVYLSVILVIHAETVQDIEKHFTPYDRAMFLVS